MRKKYTNRDATTSKPYVRKNDRKSGVKEDERIEVEEKLKPKKYKAFHIEFKNQMQKFAWGIFQEHEFVFLLGPAGTAKSFLAVAFAISELLARKVDKIIIARPIVEAGENLGFLPGTLEEKVDPYLRPIMDCVTKLVGKEGPQREMIDKAIEVSPLAYMRGRAQPLDAKVLTPNGFVKMGDIQIGDEVVGSAGEIINVIGVFPQGMKKIYEVKFSDGTFTRCCGEHLWATTTLSERRHKKDFSVKNTLEIQKTLKNRHNQKNHKIPVLSAGVDFNWQEVDIDPYLLGLLLGDGSLHESASLSFSTADNELVRSVEEAVCELSVNQTSAYDYRISSPKSSGIKNDLRANLSDLGLLGKKSYNKFIPECYKINTVEVRKAVFAGLLDTDGNCSSHRSGSSRVQYYTTSEQLADDVAFIARSLGCVVYKRLRQHKKGVGHLVRGHMVYHRRDSYVLDINCPFNPFVLARKQDQFNQSCPLNKFITEINEIDECECQCIQVDSLDHLYVTDDFILTHNTFDNAVCILDEAQNATKQQLKMFSTRKGENCKMVVTGDSRQSDLHNIDSPLMDTVRRLERLTGVGIIEFQAKDCVRDKMVTQIINALED